MSKFRASLRGRLSKAGVFSEIKKGLKIPYIKEDWDFLFDILSDLEWIPENTISEIFIGEDFSMEEHSDEFTLIEILRAAAKVSSEVNQSGKRLRIEVAKKLNF